MKKIVSYIICIILVAIILVATAIHIASNTVLNKNYVLEKLDNNNYYEKTYDNIKSSFSQYILQSGLDENVIENLYTKEQIKEDVDIVISNIYSDENQKVDTNKIKNNMESNINKYLEDNNIKLNATQKKSIDKFIETIERTYEEEISYSAYLNKIGNKVYKINKIIEKMQPVIYGSIIALFLILILINVKEISFGINYAGVTILSSGIANILIKMYINSKININKIMIINEDISKIVINILNEIVKYIQSYGLVMVAIGLAIVILASFIRNSKTEEM